MTTDERNRTHIKRLSLAEDIYKAYPRHVAKPPAIRAIVKALMKVDAKALLAKTKAYAASVEGMAKCFVPYPATFFNREMYNDDLDEINANPKDVGRIEPPEGKYDSFR